MAKPKDPWIVKPFKIPEENGYLVLAVDTHTATPHGLLWMWIDYRGEFHELLADGKPNYYEVAELFDNGTISQISD